MGAKAADVYEALTLRIEVDRDGTRKYFNSAGVLHRDEGPAVEWAVGTKAWFQNGKLHREDGPAVIYPNGYSRWCLHGVRYTKLDYYQELVDRGLYKDC